MQRHISHSTRSPVIAGGPAGVFVRQYCLGREFLRRLHFMSNKKTVKSVQAFVSVLMEVGTAVEFFGHAGFR